MLITGAAGDIGNATAQAFAKRGAKLVLVDLPQSQQKMIRSGSDLLKQGASSVHVLSVDVTKAEEVRQMVDDAVELSGSIDCFFNNAGIQGELRPLHQQSVEKFQQTIQVNTFGVFLGMKYVSLAMIKAKKGGVIVNTSSVAGLLGPANMAAYAASKFGVVGLTRTGAKDLAPHGIRVCGIAPGILEGKMWSSQVRGNAQVLRELEGLSYISFKTNDDYCCYKPGKSGDVTEEDIIKQEERMVLGTPLRRRGKLSEVAEVVVFLCSDSASYITGEVVTIDGGRRA